MEWRSFHERADPEPVVRCLEFLRRRTFQGPTSGRRSRRDGMRQQCVCLGHTSPRQHEILTCHADISIARTMCYIDHTLCDALAPDKAEIVYNYCSGFLPCSFPMRTEAVCLLHENMRTGAAFYQRCEQILYHLTRWRVETSVKLETAGVASRVCEAR